MRSSENNCINSWIGIIELYICRTGRISSVGYFTIYKYVIPNTWVSLDSSSPQTVTKALNLGLIDMINDVYAGQKKEGDETTFTLAAKHHVPLILMHMQNTPDTMQENPNYKNCTEEVCHFLREKVNLAKELGVKDILVDPGIGFGKTLKNNHELLSKQAMREMLKIAPVLIGLSRKRFLAKQLPENHPGITNPIFRDKLTKDWEIHCISQGASVIRTHKLLNEV